MLSTTHEIEIEADSPEHRLWMMVIARTVQEWVSGPQRLQRTAEDFLFHNTRDFDTVCQAAGLEPQSFRGKLMKFRNRRTATAEASLN